MSQRKKREKWAKSETYKKYGDMTPADFDEKRKYIKKFAEAVNLTEAEKKRMLNVVDGAEKRSIKLDRKYKHGNEPWEKRKRKRK